MSSPAPGLLHRLVSDDVLPNHLPEVAWLRQYLSVGAPHGEPIMLSLGETWDHTPGELLEALRRAPHDTHGYQISMYGLPRLRRVLKEYIASTQRLPETDAWEVAVTWTGTRSAMRDFASLLRHGPRDVGPTALAVAPSWDYAGFLEPLGFRMAYVPTEGARSLQPTTEAITEQAAAQRDLGLVIINAQHNPTGASWNHGIVETLIDVAFERGAAILVDDAYYGFPAPDDKPTSAVEVLLDKLAGAPSPVPWLAVRSLGKQFHCNGWAIGAVLAEPALLDVLVNDVRPRHSFNYSGMPQWAMAEWLENRPEVDRYLDGRRRALAGKRKALASLVGEPAGALPVVHGPAAPYLLYPVPKTAGARTVPEYIHAAVRDAGVVLSDAWPLAREADAPDTGYVRMYLGPDLPVLSEACQRLASAGLLA